MVASLVTRFTDYGDRLRSGLSYDAADSVAQSFQPALAQYAAAEAYYDNLAYTLLPADLKRQGGPALYRATTGVYNPIGRAVDWYAGALYPGAMTDDGLPLPDGTPCMVPFDPATDAAIRLAAMTALGTGWGNWGTESYVLSRTLPKLGDAFGEIEIDLGRGKAYPRLHWPGYVTSLSFNGSGDVIGYRLDIPQIDEKGMRYVWGKIVDKETITTLRDGEPAGYGGEPATTANPFGFVPAVWVQFRNDGGQHGRALWEIVRAKLDRLNSSASSIHDYIGKFSAQGVVLKTDKSLKDGAIFTLNGLMQPITEKNANDEIRFLKGPADLEIDRLLQNLGLGEAQPYLAGLLAEIEADLPESTIDREMRANPQMSGVSRRMTFGDVEKRHREVSGNADAALRKLIQMNLAVMGHLLQTGAFGPRSRLTATQRLFLPFGLDSYEKGDLNFNFVARPLFPDTAMDRAQAALLREKIMTPQGLIESGYSAVEVYGEGNVPDPPESLMQQRQSSRQSAGDAFGALFNAGQIG
jgi:hypothetical protein